MIILDSELIVIFFQAHPFPISYGLNANQFSIAVESIKPFLKSFKNPDDLETPFRNKKETIRISNTI